MTLCTKFALAPWPDMVLGSFRNVSKKWTDQCEDSSPKKNKTRTSKVGAISKAQKPQNIFFWKKLEFFDFFSFKKCRIVPKNVKGGPFGFKIHTVAKFQKTRKEDPLGSLKIFLEKCRRVPKKIQKGTL